MSIDSTQTERQLLRALTLMNSIRAMTTSRVVIAFSFDRVPGKLNVELLGLRENPTFDNLPDALQWLDNTVKSIIEYKEEEIGALKQAMAKEPGNTP